MKSVKTKAELKEASVDCPAYLVDGDIHGMFVPCEGVSPYPDPGEAVYVVSNTSGFYWKRLFDGPLNFLWFGADRNYTPTTNNCTPWQHAVDMLQYFPHLHIPYGRYGFTSAPQLDQSRFKTLGAKITGDGRSRSIFDLRSVTSSPNFLWHASDGNQSDPLGHKDNFYVMMEDLGIIGNVNGYVFQMGMDDFSDPVNMPVMNRVSIQNFNPTGSSRGAKFNYVCGGDFNIQVNCGSGGYQGGNGIALTLSQTVFSRFFGSIGSAETAILMQDGANYGNHFDCMDMENVKICWRILSGTAWNNKATAGQWSYSVAGIDHQVGNSNLVEVPNIAQYVPNFVAASVGLRVISKGILASGSPWLI